MPAIDWRHYNTNTHHQRLNVRKNDLVDSLTLTRCLERTINVGADDLQDINVWVEPGVIVPIILTPPVIRPRTGDDSYQFLLHTMRRRQHRTVTHFHHRKQTGNKTTVRSSRTF